MIIASNGFENSVSMIETFEYTETINFFHLSTCSNTSLNSTVWLSCMKIWKNHIHDRAGFVLACRGALGFTAIFPSGLLTSRHWLTHWLGMILYSTKSHKVFAQIQFFPYKSFIHYNRQDKEYRRVTSHIFFDFLNQIPIQFIEGIKLWICWFLWANVGHIG